MTDSGVVRSVTAQLRETLSEEQVKAVLEALEAVKTGDPVGTVVEEPGTGNIGVRVSEEGVHLWVVVGLDGAVSKDTQGTLAGWTPR